MQFSRLFTFFVTFSAAIGGILYGYDIGVVSGALLFVKHSIPMTMSEEGMMVGAVMGGSLIGTLISGTLADVLGRRRMIEIACYGFLIGIITILMAKTFHAIFFARLILGVAVGMVSVVIPLYIAEIAPAKIRGRSVTLFQLFLTLGILLAYFVDLLFTPSGNWRAMFAVISIPAVALLVAMRFLPETPRWLMLKNKHARAKSVLAKIYPAEKAKIEYDGIAHSFRQQEGSWADLFSQERFLPLLIGVMVALCSQFVGINALLQYAPLVIQKTSHYSNVFTMLGTVGMGLMNCIATLLAMAFIDSIGRKKLLMTGAAGITISALWLSTLASGWWGEPSGGLVVCGLMAYIISFAIGPGVVVWLVISELFPTSIRGRGIALCLFVNSGAGALISSVFLEFVHLFSLAGTYLLFAVSALIYLAIATFFLPETSGRTLEQVQLSLEEQASFVVSLKKSTD